MDIGAVRVLVVDDHPDTVESTALYLGLSGYEAAIAYDGREALARAYDFHPDVVLLDIALPNMDGYAVAKALRGANLPIDPVLVAVTGYSRVVDRQRSAEAGFDLHLTKPVDTIVLESIDLLVDEARRLRDQSLRLSVEATQLSLKAVAGCASLLMQWIEMAHTLLDVAAMSRDIQSAERCRGKAMTTYDRITTRFHELREVVESDTLIQITQAHAVLSRRLFSKGG